MPERRADRTLHQGRRAAEGGEPPPGHQRLVLAHTGRHVKLQQNDGRTRDGGGRRRTPPVRGVGPGGPRGPGRGRRGQGRRRGPRAPYRTAADHRLVRAGREAPDLEI